MDTLLSSLTQTPSITPTDPESVSKNSGTYFILVIVFAITGVILFFYQYKVLFTETSYKKLSFKNISVINGVVSQIFFALCYSFLSYEIIHMKIFNADVTQLVSNIANSIVLFLAILAFVLSKTYKCYRLYRALTGTTQLFIASIVSFLCYIAHSISICIRTDLDREMGNVPVYTRSKLIDASQFLVSITNLLIVIISSIIRIFYYYCYHRIQDTKSAISSLNSKMKEGEYYMINEESLESLAVLREGHKTKDQNLKDIINESIGKMQNINIFFKEAKSVLQNYASKKQKRLLYTGNHYSDEIILNMCFVDAMEW